MANDIVNLGDARANKSGCAKDWTPLEALRHAISEIEAGRIKADRMYIAFAFDREDALTAHQFIASGTKNHLETCGLLAIHLHERSGG